MPTFQTNAAQSFVKPTGHRFSGAHISTILSNEIFLYLESLSIVNQVFVLFALDRTEELGYVQAEAAMTHSRIRVISKMF